MLKHFLKGLCAGILISIGGGVFLNCDNRIVGTFLFSVALLCICMLGYTLYTGKICYITDNFNVNGFLELIFGLFGNIVACAVCGLLIRISVPSIGAAADALCINKLSSQLPWQALIRALFCGMLVYLSVDIYKKKNSVIGILICIPAFILSGYEHSIADMFYFFSSTQIWKSQALESVVFIAIVLAGNSLGGLILPLLMKAAGEKNEK